MRLLTKHSDLGREVWVNFDKDAEVYELFASEAADDYIGCADTLKEAREIAQWWFEELMF
jgi:hypothetical protein